MQSGPNKHYIPQLHLRSFGVPANGKETKIWAYRKGAAPKEEEIDEIGAEDFFYPEALDRKITLREREIKKTVFRVRDQKPGTNVSRQDARDIILHLAPRTAQLRSAMTEAATTLFKGAQRVFTDRENMERLLGLDARAPTGMLAERINAAVATHKGLARLELPASIVARMLFWFSKEQHSEFLQPTMLGYLFGSLISEAEALTSKAHNQALDSMVERDAPGRDLSGFDWVVQQAPPPCAVVPDCVAIAIEADGSVHPFMTASFKNVTIIICALGKKKVLVGRRSDAPALDLTVYNSMAASCSDEFFGAPINSEVLSHLSSLIGKRSRASLQQVATEVIREYEAPVRSVAIENAACDTPPATAPLDNPIHVPDYKVSFLSCADTETAEKIARGVGTVVRHMSERLVLDRIDGITFASDYPAALRDVDRGRSDLAPAETIHPDEGVGIAQCVLVLREGIIKGRLVFADWIGHALIEEPPSAHLAFAIHSLTYQLARLAVTEAVDRRFPGFLLAERDESKASGWKLASVYSAYECYVCAFTSAGFEEGEERKTIYVKQLCAALEAAYAQIPPARIAYRFHGDMSVFFAVLLSAIDRVLSCAADLLGECEATGQPVPTHEAELRGLLDRHQLSPWLNQFHADLKTVDHRFGRWESLEELKLLEIHFERLCWFFGVFPGAEDENPDYIHVPLVSDMDILALLQPPPPSENSEV